MWNKIILRGIKRNKKEYFLIVGGLAALIVLSLSFLVVQESYIQAKKEVYFQKYGAWTGSISGSTDEMMHILEKEDNVKEIGHIKLLKDCYIAVKNVKAKIGSIDAGMFELGRMELLSGSMPKKENEIVIDEFGLRSLDADAKVGNTITLTFVNNDGEKQVDFVLSGILKEWGKEWIISQSELPSILISDKSQLYNYLQAEPFVYFGVEELEKNVLGAVSDIMKEEDSIYTYNSPAYAYNTGNVERFMESGTLTGILSLFSAIMIIYILLASYHNRKYRIDILTTIGADHTQIIQMIFKEALYYARMAVLLVSPLILFAISIYFIKYRFSGMVISVNIMNIVIMLIIILSIFFVGNIVICLLALDSSVTSGYKKDNIYTYYQKLPVIRKVKKITCFRLYLRNRIFKRKQAVFRIMVFFTSIVLIVTIFIDLLNGIMRYQNEKDDIQFEYTVDIQDIKKD